VAFAPTIARIRGGPLRPVELHEHTRRPSLNGESQTSKTSVPRALLPNLPDGTKALPAAAGTGISVLFPPTVSCRDPAWPLGDARVYAPILVVA
jgi:hypothetical protein